MTDNIETEAAETTAVTDGVEQGETQGTSLLTSSDTQPDASNAEKDTEGAQDATKDAESGKLEPYTLNTEGVRIDAAQIKAFEKEAYELGIPSEAAQKLLDSAHKNYLVQEEAHKKQVERWADEVRMDKDMGGAAFDATVMAAKASLQKFDADGKVLSMLESTGYANNPDVIRFLSAVGRAHGEDGFVSGKETSKNASLEKVLFPNTPKYK